MARESPLTKGSLQTLSGIQHKPHFCLAVRHAVFLRHGIVRMNLYGKVFASINEFDEQREAVAEFFIVAVSHQGCSVAVDQCGQCHSCVDSFSHNGFVTLDTRKLPAFTYFLKVCSDPFVSGDSLATPDCRF